LTNFKIESILSSTTMQEIKLMLCEHCKEKEIYATRRPLCKECYQELHKQKNLDLYPLTPSPLKRHRVKMKYGDDFVNEIINLKNNNESLSGIGRKYHLSRERIRQIYEEVNGFKFTAVLNVRSANKKESRAATAQLHKNPTHKVNTYKKNSPIYKGAIAEKKVLDICSTLGYKVEAFTKDCSIDMIINGYRVDVKASYTPFKNPALHVIYYRFALSNEQQKNADFIVCWISKNNHFFVLPKSVFPAGKSLYIPAERINRSAINYYRYLEAWHLLARREKHDYVFNNQDI
jgi:hypothetical protein